MTERLTYRDRFINIMCEKRERGYTAEEQAEYRAYLEAKYARFPEDAPEFKAYVEKEES